MIEVRLPHLFGPEADAFGLLFELRDAFPEGWTLAGAQMVILHLAAHAVARPARTRDTDILVDVRTVQVREIVAWLTSRGFQPGPASGGFGVRPVVNEFRRGAIHMDVLAIDRVGDVDLTSDPPAETVQVPGGRYAIGRVIDVELDIGSRHGVLPLPDWLGALVLKGRAARQFPADRVKHLSDAALLAALPVNLPDFRPSLTASTRKRLRDLQSLLADSPDAWLLLGETPLRRSDAEAALQYLAG